MVQSFDNSYFKPIYNGVNINITKPKVLVDNENDNNNNNINMENGIYNAVNISVDEPSVQNQNRQKIYDYPLNNQVITYDMLCTNQISVPAELLRPVVPKPNYTTVEAEKGKPDKTAENETESAEQNIKADDTTISFQANPSNIKTPEIIPSEDIKPEVDIQTVVNNLTSSDYDVQAKQMAEIVKKTSENSDNGIPYIVRDVFSALIDITNKDTSKLAAPTEEQTQARQKIIVNFITLEQNPKLEKLPYEINENDIKLANSLSPMEQAERNKEYALYSMAFLAKVYTDEVQKHTGNVVPMTDIPGVSDMVETLKTNPNTSLKIASIEALNHVYRPEYKDEMSAIFGIASNDKNPQVSNAAKNALIIINNK